MFTGKTTYKTVFIFIVVAAALIWVITNQPEKNASSQAAGEEQITAIRRINSDQYRNIIREIFGETIVVEGRFADAVPREEGLMAVGASQSGLSAAGFTVAEGMARKVASQVVDAEHRNVLLPCRPVSVSAFDQACASQFISAVGRLLYRRNLTANELQDQLQSAATFTEEHQDFYAGLERSLINMLISPNFLFRIEYAIAEAGDDSKLRLTALSKASRLSFLLWNSTPDDTLLSAAETGDLDTDSGIRQQVDRMLRSNRVENGVRGFFADMLVFEEYETLSKDLAIYPKFTNEALKDMGEQTLRTIVDHVVNREDDYRQLFITPHTFLTPALAALIGVPLVQAVENAAPDRWTPFDFKPGDPRAGILAQPGFVALHSHPGRTSPTLRGKALREVFLCQEVPDPPGDVDFSLVQDTSNPNYKTMRQRLTAHATAPTCAGCHKITDPIGLALETFDGAGSFRTRENGESIDTSGEMDGVRYENTAGLSQLLSNNPDVSSCLVKRVYSYGIGRGVEAADRKWLKSVRKDFARKGYKFLDLLRQIATSDEFYRGVVREREAVAQR